MQTRAFAAHLDELPIKEQTRRDRLRTLERLEQLERVDLDEEYRRDGLRTLMERYTYSREDERRGRVNPIAFTVNKNLFDQIAWYRSQLSAYRRFKEGVSAEDEAVSSQVPSDEPSTEATSAAVALTFGLEADLQRALRASIEDLEANLIVADGGGEIHVESAFIDILAKDANDCWVVIELKAGKARAEAVAQVLAYMGCIAESRGGDVRGILIAADFDSRVEFAARAVPNLELRRYRYRFSFE